MPGGGSGQCVVVPLTWALLRVEPQLVVLLRGHDEMEESSPAGLRMVPGLRV